MDKPRYFPPAESANPLGLVHLGGELSVEWLCDAYRHGIFPWPHGQRYLMWFSPDPRAVLEFDHLYISRRLARTIRSGRFTVTCNRDFAAVMFECGHAGDRYQGTWITPEMKAAYHRLHEHGMAHSIEVWHNGVLVGGTYGVAVGAVFCAESMFHLMSDASKVALVALVRHLQARGYRTLDIQQLTPHTASMGGSEIPRSQYLARVRAQRSLRVSFGSELQFDPAAVVATPRHV
jgi:leucyl/phenylalanyl-tRNA--protein transferase